MMSKNQMKRQFLAISDERFNESSILLVINVASKSTDFSCYLRTLSSQKRKRERETLKSQVHNDNLKNYTEEGRFGTQEHH